MTRNDTLDIDRINEALARLTSLSNIIMGASLVNDGAAIRRAAVEIDEHVITIQEQVNLGEGASGVSQAAK